MKQPKKKKRNRLSALYSRGRTNHCTPPDLVELLHRFGSPGRHQVMRHAFPGEADSSARIRGIGLDPCSGPQSVVNARVAYYEADDGLSLPWSGVGLVYVNPPYGRAIAKWVRRASIDGDETVLCVPARTDTEWWCNYVWPRATAIAWIRGRVPFIDGDTGAIQKKAPFPVSVIYYGSRARAQVFESIFRARARVWITGLERDRRQGIIPGLCGCGHVLDALRDSLCRHCRRVISQSETPAIELTDDDMIAHPPVLSLVPG